MYDTINGFKYSEDEMLDGCVGKLGKMELEMSAFGKHRGVATIGDKLQYSFKMIWTCPTQANNRGGKKENFLYVG